MTTAVIYIRVSTEEQTKGYSLATQAEHCQDYAKSHGYSVVEQFQDTKSGEELERPGLDSLYEYVSQNPVNVAVVYDTDRLSRGGPAHTAIIEMRLEKYGVRLEYVRGDYNDNTPESALSLMIKQSIAWYENQQRKERSLRGKRGKVKSGKVIIGARSPYGYDYEDGELLINEEEAAVVRQIFGWVINEKYSTIDISKKLCEARIPTRADKASFMRKNNSYGIWGPSTVKKILKNPTYTGKWFYNKTMTIKVDGKRKQIPRPRDEWIEVAVPMIIDEDTFDQAQAQLHKNRAVSKRNTKHEYLLQGMIFCVCGLSCHCSHRRELYYYKCKVKGGQTWKRECQTRFGVRAHVLEALVWQAVTDLLLNPQYLKEAIKKQRSTMQSEIQSFDEKMSAANSAIADTKRKLGILVDQMLDEEFPKEVLDDRRKLLLDKLSQLQQQRGHIESQRASAMITEEQEQTLIGFAASIKEGLELTTFEQKRVILKILRVRVDALDKHTVKVSGYIPFSEDVLDIGSFVAPSY